MSDEFRIPDGITPIVAKRTWLLLQEPEGWRLGSVAMGAGFSTWMPLRAAEARCAHRRHGRQTWEAKPTREVQAQYPAGGYTGGSVPIGYISSSTASAMNIVFTPPFGSGIYQSDNPPHPDLPTTLAPEGFSWVPGEIIYDVELPVESCTCGIYAAKDWGPVPRGDVRGEVYLWGKVITADRGYRAQYAYPKCFTDWDADYGWVVEAADAYKVPIVAGRKRTPRDVPEDASLLMLKMALAQLSGRPKRRWWRP